MGKFLFHVRTFRCFGGERIPVTDVEVQYDRETLAGAYAAAAVEATVRHADELTTNPPYEHCGTACSAVEITLLRAGDASR